MKCKMSGLGNFGAGEEGGMCEACPELFIPSASSCQSSLFSMDLSFARFLLIFRHVLWFPIEKCFFLIVYSRKVMCKKGSFFLSYFCYYFFHPKLESNFFTLKQKSKKGFLHGIVFISNAVCFSILDFFCVIINVILEKLKFASTVD